MLIETGADDTNFGAMVCHWDESAALRLIRDQLADLQRDTVEDGIKFGAPKSKALTEDDLQWLLDEWMREAQVLLEQYAPGIFFSAQARLMFAVLSKLIERHFRMPLGKEWRNYMSALFKKKENEMVGVRRGRETGKKDAKPRKPREKRPKSMATLRNRILAAIRKVGREPVHKNAVASNIGVSAPTLGLWLEKIRAEFGEDWEDLVTKGLRTKTKKGKK